MDVVNTATLERVKAVLVEVLGIEDRAAAVDASTPLLDGLPELDSLAVVELVTALRERLGAELEDDEINAEVFATLGSLAAAVDAKLQAD